MKGSLFWRFAYLCCALTGILAGYGMFSLTGVKENREDIGTKDNTLVRETGDGVFFDEEGETKLPIITIRVTTAPTPTWTWAPVPSEIPELTASPTVQPEETPDDALEILPKLPDITMEPEQTVSAGQSAVTLPEDVLPSLGSQWAGKGMAVVPEQEPVLQTTEEPENSATEVITYPAKIFGQTPVINRSDAYVSYFEFCYDLIAIVEPKVQARGLNINTLMTKFALKALFCGIDIEQLDINAPIPRRLAALCLWLAAQVLNESGWDTSAKSVENYVTDISGCTASEKKAIAYLYESGVLKGYQVSGQKFYPDAGLKTESGSKWLSEINRCWK